jgi:hypothetical protein
MLFPNVRGLSVLFLFLSLGNFSAVGQEKITISGYVKEAETGESFIGASIFNQANTNQATSTNTYGFYSISLIPGKYTLVFRALGRLDEVRSVNLTSDQSLSVELRKKVIEKSGVTITAERSNAQVENTEMGRVSLEVDKIKTLPAFMGEVDVLKVLQLTPGVKNSGDGNAGLYVRGGGPDQNLILLDGAQVYNPFHLLGFFSLFNENSVNNLELIKGGMPANYGGRLASVLDVTMREGNLKKWKVDGGLGLISSRLTIQGPLKKDTSSIIFSARRSYADVVARPLLNNIERAKPFRNSGIYFYDLNLKLNYRISDKDRLFLSGYFGRDKFIYSNQRSGFTVEMPWGNAIATARWNHLFSRKLFMNTAIIFTDFSFEFAGKQQDFDARLYSGIRDWNLKVDLDYYPNILHRVKFGGIYTYHRFTPFNTSAQQGEVKFDLGAPVNLFAHEVGLYAQDEFDLGERFRINAGLRYSMFQHVGPFDRFIKDGNDITIDTTRYAAGQNIKTYHGLEPRLSVRFALGEHNSIKASYTRNYQYLHLASLSTLALPTDLWIPSTSIIRPQRSDQISAGYFHNFFNDMFETSVEVYYKDMRNQVEFKEGYLPENSVKDNNDYAFTFGRGEAYGVEFFIKKKYGKLDGWIGYTWSKTLRTFPELNQGMTYYAPYDRRHDGSFVLSYHASSKWTFGLVFVFATGRPITLPEQRYILENRIANQYGPRNSIRLDPYHRLDLSATWQLRKRKHFEQSLNFSVFNVYNRQNPFFIYFDATGNLSSNSLSVQAKQVALFPIIPSVTWNFTF